VALLEARTTICRNRERMAAAAVAGSIALSRLHGKHLEQFWRWYCSCLNTGQNRLAAPVAPEEIGRKERLDRAGPRGQPM